MPEIQASDSWEQFICEKHTLLKILKSRRELKLPVSLFMKLLGINFLLLRLKLTPSAALKLRT